MTHQYHLAGNFWCHEENLNSSTASNSKNSMADSSGHRNDAGNNAAGTDASSYTTSHSSTELKSTVEMSDS